MKQPGYRKARAHAEFITNLGLPAEAVKEALREIWRAKAPASSPPAALLHSLVTKRYLRREWTLKL